ncbi:uncharacterized protein [Misgurnus anguillicaudatus]|uniref:uncharacterized protein n=1 Tax=Misgurnus anguillicaudatus TaxID=75329 RepID=UPI003CCF3839
MSGSVKDDIDKSSIMDSGEIEERIVDIYITAEAVRDLKHKKEVEDFNITTTKPTEPTGSECVMNRSYRSVTVCLVLLCVLLLTAVIVLCVLIITINHQFYITSKNITEERDQLLTKYTNITDQRDQLLTKYTNITKERDQLLTNNTITDGWKEYKSSLYFISSEKKTWNDSRTNCTQRGADLIIINNQEEQGFVKSVSGIEHWIGLSDSDEEGRWKWVDGSTQNTSFSFWDKSTNEPNGATQENCAASIFDDTVKSLAATDHSALICLSPRAPTCIHPDKMQAEHPAHWSPSGKHTNKRLAASDLEVEGEETQLQKSSPSMERLDMGTCAPPSLKKAWRVINSAELSSLSASITSGHFGHLKTTAMYLHDLPAPSQCQARVFLAFEGRAYKYKVLPSDGPSLPESSRRVRKWSLSP